MGEARWGSAMGKRDGEARWGSAMGKRAVDDGGPNGPGVCSGRRDKDRAMNSGIRLSGPDGP